MLKERSDSMVFSETSQYSFVLNTTAIFGRLTLELSGCPPATHNLKEITQH
jgi:hypothetical protein